VVSRNQLSFRPAIIAKDPLMLKLNVGFNRKTGKAN
jgi:hypothetical protein